MNGVAAQTAPLLKAGGGDGRGCVVLGTVQGDIHDIGKNLVATQLGVAGYEVLDLGVDVAPETFVAKVAELEAGVVALSCLLTVGFESMKRTVAALRDAAANGGDRGSWSAAAPSTSRSATTWAPTATAPT